MSLYLRTALVLVLASISVGCSRNATPSPQGSAPSTSAVTSGDENAIVYVLPQQLPEGWTVHVATERVGPPPDYTVSWTPAELAGADRAEAVDLPDEGPTLFINVGARAYARMANISAEDPATAEVTTTDGLLRLEFLMDGSPVSVGGRDVDEAAVRTLATSLQLYDRETWRSELGERLLVDDPPG